MAPRVASPSGGPSHGVKLAGDDADDFVIWGQHTLRTKAGKGRDKDPEK